MAYTAFGEYVRILRIKNHEVMGDMAQTLGTSAAFLSAVETGKKNVPVGWSEKIAEHYGLSSAEKDELDSAIEKSKTHAKIDLKDVSNTKREMALQVARSFEGIDDETAAKIIALLEGKQL